MPLSLIESLTPTFVIGVLTLNILVLVVLVLFSLVWLRYLVSTESETARRKKEAEKIAQDIIARSRSEAERVRSEAQEKSAELFRTAEFLKDESEKQLKEALREHAKYEIERLAQLTEEFLRVYRSELASAKKAYALAIHDVKTSSAKALGEAVRALTEKGAEALREFQKLTEEETAHYKVAADERVREWHERMRNEIEARKKEELARIEKSLYQIISHVSKEVLGHALGLEDHEKLVLKALDEAKREGFFVS